MLADGVAVGGGGLVGDGGGGAGEGTRVAVGTVGNAVAVADGASVAVGTVGDAVGVAGGATVADGAGVADDAGSVCVGAGLVTVACTCTIISVAGAGMLAALSLLY